MAGSPALRVFPFRYKLTLVISTVVVALLVAIFLVVQRYIESEFRGLVAGQLERAERFVSKEMQDRHAQLRANAVTVSGLRLVHDILTDRTLSHVTRQDILAEEICPELVDVDLVAVLDAEGSVLASDLRLGEDAGPVIDVARATAWYADLLQGDEVSGHVRAGDEYHQLVGRPVFLAEQMIGAVLMGRVLTREHLVEIEQVSDADIVVLADGDVALSTRLTGAGDDVAPEAYLRAFRAWLTRPDRAETPRGRTAELRLLGERFLARIHDDRDGFVPPYAVVQSLDRRLAFLDELELTTLAIGALGVGMGIAMGFAMALAVSRPIRILHLATREVEKENLDHRVDIRTRDEFAQLGQSFNRMVSGLADRRRIRAALDKSVSREVADHILRADANLGGERRRVTVLFSDIRAFSTLAETLDPARLIDLLNAYFTRINACIRSHHGITDKFIGDAIMALYGAPIARESHALDAVRTSLDMFGVLDAFNRDVAEPRHGCRLRIGVGINTGDVVAGLVGSEDRLAYTCVGDDVNLASRLESLTSRYGAEIVLGESSFRELQRTSPEALAEIPIRELDRVRVKGRTADVAVYEVLRRVETVEELQPQLELFAEALQRLRGADFDAARTRLESILAAAPRDAAARAMLERCERYAANPELYEREYDRGVRTLSEK